jgi:1-deoxy-D-xylulose-5-phosphate reductoisomerase
MGVAVLGSTGSIGRSSLEVLTHLTALGEEFHIVGLCAHNNVELLARQVMQFQPAEVVVTGSGELREVPAGVRVSHGAEAAVELVRRPDVQIVIAAMVGAAGLPAVFEAVRLGKRVALANKESLVVAGELLMPLAASTGAEILPLDSEHSAIFQAMASGKRAEVRRAILTASGGPFRTSTAADMRAATVEAAMAHPTWRMGGKITIDSATLFNKALEFIEAHWLFGLPAQQIDVVVHPQSIVHSMVEFVDGSVIAQLSPPDMRLPIQYTLTYPRRVEGVARRMDFASAVNMTFEPPDETRFPALRLAREVVRRGGTSGAIFNAANEVAVAAFLAGKLRLTDISSVVESTLEALDVELSPTVDQLTAVDHRARSVAGEAVGRLAG